MQIFIVLEIQTKNSYNRYNRIIYHFRPHRQTPVITYGSTDPLINRTRRKSSLD